MNLTLMWVNLVFQQLYTYCNHLYFVILTGSHYLHKNKFVKKNIHCYLNKFYEINSLYLKAEKLVSQKNLRENHKLSGEYHRAHEAEIRPHVRRGLYLHDYWNFSYYPKVKAGIKSKSMREEEAHWEICPRWFVTHSPDINRISRHCLGHKLWSSDYKRRGKIISPVLLFQLLLYRQCSVSE
jgi:hypothetical protein